MTPCTLVDTYRRFVSRLVAREPGITVGVANRYGLDGLVIESRWVRGEIFRTGPGAHPASCKMGTGSFPGIKRPGRGFDHPPTYSSEVKRTRTILLVLPLWGLRARSTVNVTFTFTFLDMVAAPTPYRTHHNKIHKWL